jgi:TnpA family transposase
LGAQCRTQAKKRSDGETAFHVEIVSAVRVTLEWLQDPELRRRSHVGLNKGEQQTALRRAVFFNRLGEIRDSLLRKPAPLRQRS